MTPQRLASLAAYAGDRLRPGGASGPHRFNLDVPVTNRNAIYIVCAWSGRTLYVGSTTVGLRSRFTQHLTDLPKTLDWSSVYVIPLDDATPAAEVRRIEGRIGLVVRPERTKALPRLGS